MANMLLKAVVIGLVAVVTFGVIKKMGQMGVFQHYFKHHPGTCSHVKGLDFGSENFRILSSGLTFMTSGFTYAPSGPYYEDYLTENKIKGKIYIVDMNKPNIEATELKFKANKNFNLSIFRPHGIDVIEDPKKGHHLLYVVNHPVGGNDQVEKFRYLPESQELEHLNYFSSELFNIINDVALVGEDSFYVTNYLYFKSHSMSTVEQLIGFKLGGVVYFDGTSYRNVVTGLFGANGIILSENKRYLYVALLHSQDVHVYEVNPDMTLKCVQDVRVHTSVDNFHFSQDGKSLYCGCHPIGVKITQHLDDPRIKAPSQVIQLPLKDGRIEEGDISQVFYDHGDLIAGSAVASVYKKKLLIGSVIDKLVICDLP